MIKYISIDDMFELGIIEYDKKTRTINFINKSSQNIDNSELDLDLAEYIVEKINFYDSFKCGSLYISHCGVTRLDFNNVIHIADRLTFRHLNQLEEIIFPEKTFNADLLFEDVGIIKLDLSNVCKNSYNHTIEIEDNNNLNEIIFGTASIDWVVLNNNPSLNKINFVNTKIKQFYIDEQLKNTKIRYKGHCLISENMQLLDDSMHSAEVLIEGPFNL